MRQKISGEKRSLLFSPESRSRGCPIHHIHHVADVLLGRDAINRILGKGNFHLKVRRELLEQFKTGHGVEFIAPLGVSTESEASARDIAGIITQVRAAKIPAVFLENITDPRLMGRISAETGARVGGTLYSDSLTGEKGDSPTYIAMVRHNIKALTSALSQ